jgi:DNA uptake protein ComE-like DNA-binding protein
VAEEALVRALFVLALFFIVTSADGAPLAWEQWDGCTLEADRYFDGDSFQVKHRGAVHVLRLYFVDAPETDAGYGQRVGEQAAYFGVKPEEVLRGGAAAKEFTAKFLGQPFRVITRRQGAPGASRSERYYAIVERDGWRLDAALVQAGLARATSEVADFPDAAAGQQRALQLRSLEQKAAQERQGLWEKSQRTDRQETLVEKLTPRFLKPAGSLPAPRKVNLNTATQLDLEALPGIGPKTAGAIIRARPIRSFEQFDTVPGIGPKKIEALRNLVSFE